MQYSSGNPAGQIICWWLFQYVALMCAHIVGEQHKCVTGRSWNPYPHRVEQTSRTGCTWFWGETRRRQNLPAHAACKSTFVCIFFDNCHARLGTAWVLPHPVSTMTVWMLSLHKGSPFCISAHHSLSSNHIHDRKVLIILFRKFQVMIACVRNLLLETIKATH